MGYNLIMRHAEKYAIDHISQTVVSPSDVSCSGTAKEDIPPGETEMTSMMSGKTKAYLM